MGLRRLSSRFVLASSLIACAGASPNGEDELVTPTVMAPKASSTTSVRLTSFLWDAQQSGFAEVTSRDPIRLEATDALGNVTWIADVESGADSRRIEIPIHEPGYYRLGPADRLDEQVAFFVLPVNDLAGPSDIPDL